MGRGRGRGRGRAPCCAKVGLNKGSWTLQEDLRLIAYIQKYGHANWRSLPKQAGLLRCGKSCRLRWINYLRPDVKRGNFTKEEEETVIRLRNLLGNKWSKIASCLPGRTDNEIKNVWNTHLKKKLANKDAKPEETRSPSSSVTRSVSDNQMSNGDAEQSDSSKCMTDSSSENPSDPSFDILQTSSSIPLMTSPCSSSSEVMQAFKIPEFTIEAEIWDMIDEANGGDKFGQVGLDPEKERNNNEEWLEKLERELGLWGTIEESPGSQMDPLFEIEEDPISTYFSNEPPSHP